MAHEPESKSAHLERKVYVFIGVILLLVALLATIASIGMDALSGARGFVAGEGHWSNHQKDATHHLLRYVATRDTAHYQEFLKEVELIRGVRRSRLELQKSNPSESTVEAGFVAIGIPADVVPSMSRLFRRFHDFDHIRRAVDSWVRADAALERLVRAAAALHKTLQARDFLPAERQRAIAQIMPLNRKLDELENKFSASLAEAAHWASGLLAWVLFMAAALVCLIVLWLGVLAVRVVRRVDAHAKALEAKSWHELGQTELNEQLRGEREERELCHDAICFLSRRLDAQVGAFYVAEEDGHQQLLASYAFQQRKGLSNRYAPGEGLVGQAALEREMIRVSELPEDYVRIKSGLGGASPRELLVFPLRLEQRVVGVLELGRVAPFEPHQLQFLEASAEAIAMALEAARSRRLVQALLTRTQSQAEELQSQQEELRQTNEELEQQASALQASEGRLKEQQVELEATNAELEERSEALERQRQEVSQQNRALEEARQALEDKARELGRTNRYKSDFLANMSHELRTPLNSILVLSKLLDDDRGAHLTEKQLEFARTIHDAGRELLELINDVLDLSKIEAGKLELDVQRFELATLVGGLERQFKQVCQDKGLKLMVDREAALPSALETDEQRLGQILKNFLSNAVKFTSVGEVRLEVRRPRADELAGLAADLDVAKSVAFSVSDTGVGIPAAQRDAIFEAFHQGDGGTSRRYGGTGLGLSISRTLTQLLGGAITMQSEQGKGSRFTVVLPEVCVEAAGRRPSTATNPKVMPAVEPIEVATGSHVAVAAAPAHVADDRDELGPNDRSLLIIEDDATLAKTLAELARERGFKCLVALRGLEGIELARRHAPSGILLDLGLPDLDGMGVMATLKEDIATRHIPIHIVSGREQKLAALRMGAVGYLHKPAGVPGLHEALSRLEDVAQRPVKRLLVVENNSMAQDTIAELLGDGDLEIVPARSAAEALEQLDKSSFDCMVLDLGLDDRPGVELLEQLRRGGTGHAPELPVIVYTGRDLSSEARARVDHYADRLILKDGSAAERLLDETALFLHRVEANLPEDKRRMIRMVHDREAIFRGKKVLIVDDDMRNVFALSSLLEEKELKLVVAKNGREALERLDEQPDIDLVLMDIMMPEMDGYAATRAIREQARFKTLPIIALTAKAMRNDRTQCIEAGASDYLSKPVDAEKLFSALRVWLYQRGRGSETCAA